MKKSSTIDELVDMHHKGKEIMAGENPFHNMLTYLKSFDGSNDANVLKTLLVITKSFKDNEVIKEKREEIKNKLESIVGEIH